MPTLGQVAMGLPASSNNFFSSGNQVSTLPYQMSPEEAAQWRAQYPSIGGSASALTGQSNQNLFNNLPQYQLPAADNGFFSGANGGYDPSLLPSTWRPSDANQFQLPAADNGFFNSAPRNDLFDQTLPIPAADNGFLTSGGGNLTGTIPLPAADNGFLTSGGNLGTTTNLDRSYDANGNAVTNLDRSYGADGGVQAGAAATGANTGNAMLPGSSASNRQFTDEQMRLAGLFNGGLGAAGSDERFNALLASVGGDRAAVQALLSSYGNPAMGQGYAAFSPQGQYLQSIGVFNADGTPGANFEAWQRGDFVGTGGSTDGVPGTNAAGQTLAQVAGGVGGTQGLASAISGQGGVGGATTAGSAATGSVAGPALGAMPGQVNGVPGYTGGPSFDYNSWRDPGYQFRVDQGLKGIQNSAAARGNLLSGSTLKAIENYGQDAASQEYQNAFNRFNANRGFNYTADTGDRDFNYNALRDDRNFNYTADTGNRDFLYNALVGDRNFNYGADVNNRDFNYNAQTADRNYNTALDQYNQGFGYNAQTADRQFNQNTLNTLLNAGLQGTQGQAGVNNLLATLLSQNALSAGSVGAAGTIGGNNAVTSSISQLISNLLQQQLVDRALPRNPTSGTGQ